MKDGGPAFPVYPRVQGIQHMEVKETLGMTLRDYFAAKAMQAFIGSLTPEEAQDKLNGLVGFHRISVASYHAADQMLEVRG